MFSPWKSITPSTRVPGTRSFIRLIDRSRVDFPEPDGPMIEVIWWTGTSNVTFFTARNAP